jgi:predicted phosphodiesterase
MNLLNNGKVYNNIIYIPDTHAPFTNMAALKEIAGRVKKYKPDLVVMGGDLLDEKAWSRFPKDSDDHSPHEEFEYAAEVVAKMQEWFPQMHVILGNHDLRIAKKAMEVGLTKHIVRELSEVFDCPGWTWHTDPRDKLIVATKKGPIWMLHGDEMGGNPVQKSRMLGINIIQCHTHQSSITYSNGLAHSVFAVESGHCMDQQSKGARYAFRSGRYPVLGFTEVINGQPRFISL